MLLLIIAAIGLIEYCHDIMDSLPTFNNQKSI